MKTLNVLIIGDGLAGLACAAKLVDENKVAIILEEEKELGSRYNLHELPDIQKILEYLKLRHRLAQQNTQDPFEFLAHYIEHSGGEITLETPVSELEYNHTQGKWFVITPWGRLTTKLLVIALPLQHTRNLLTPIFGRELWFASAFDDLGQSHNQPFSGAFFHGLYIAGEYTEPTIDSRSFAALESGKRVALSILKL